MNIIFAASLDKAVWLKVVIASFPPLLFFFIAFIYAIFSIWRDQNQTVISLTEKLTPRLRLDFDQNSDGIVLTPIKVYVLGEHGESDYY